MEAMRQSWSDDRLDDLQLEMRAGFARLEQQIQQNTKQIDRRFEHIDNRFEHMDTRFAQVATGIGRVDGRIDSQARAITYLATVMFTTMAGLFAAHFLG